MFRHRQSTQGNTHSGTRRFVHLAIDQNRLFQDTGFLHFIIEVITFSGTFTDTGDDGKAVMFDSDRVDQFLHQDGLTDTGTAEEADLAALDVRTQEVDDFDAGLQDLDFRLLLLKRRSGFVNDVFFHIPLQFFQTVDRLTEQIEHSSQNRFTDRDLNGLAGIDRLHASGETVGLRKSDASDFIIADILFHFTGDRLVVERDDDRVIEFRQPVIKAHIDDRADDRYDFSYIFVHDSSLAFLPEEATISFIS